MRFRDLLDLHRSANIKEGVHPPHQQQHQTPGSFTPQVIEALCEFLWGTRYFFSFQNLLSVIRKMDLLERPVLASDVHEIFSLIPRESASTATAKEIKVLKTTFNMFFLNCTLFSSVGCLGRIRQAFCSSQGRFDQHGHSFPWTLARLVTTNESAKSKNAQGHDTRAQGNN